MKREESVAVLVRRRLSLKPGIREYLRQDIVNVTALARMMAQELGMENIQAVISAIKRYKSEVEKEESEYEKRMRNLLAYCTLSMASDIAIITLAHPVEWRTLEKHLNIKHVVEGASVTNLVVDEKSVPAFKKLGLSPITIRTGLAAITMQSNTDFQATPGAMIHLLAPISYSGLNIEETLSCYSDKIIILKMEDAQKAFNILSKKIEQAREPEVKTTL